MSAFKKQLPTFVPWLAALIAIVLAISNYVSLKNENAMLRMELERVKEQNKNIFILIVKLISQGNLTLGEISPYLSEIETKSIESKIAESIRATLPFHLETQFYPSGWMGDGKFGTQYLSLRTESANVNGNNTTATRFEYRPGPESWAGGYWQYPDKNWGEKPGRSLIGATRISFYARGEHGGEIIEFKSGGITGGLYHDSFEKSLGKQPLPNDWTNYVIDLSGQNLSSVIGAFAWVAAGNDNRGHVVFYISNIVIE
jgi:hypothetical protein